MVRSSPSLIDRGVRICSAGSWTFFVAVIVIALCWFRSLLLYRTVAPGPLAFAAFGISFVVLGSIRLRLTTVNFGILAVIPAALLLWELATNEGGATAGKYIKL